MYRINRYVMILLFVILALISSCGGGGTSWKKVDIEGSDNDVFFLT